MPTFTYIVPTPDHLEKLTSPFDPKIKIERLGDKPGYLAAFRVHRAWPLSHTQKQTHPFRINPACQVTGLSLSAQEPILLNSLDPTALQTLVIKHQFDPALSANTWFQLHATSGPKGQDFYMEGSNQKDSHLKIRLPLVCSQAPGPTRQQYIATIFNALGHKVTPDDVKIPKNENSSQIRIAAGNNDLQVIALEHGMEIHFTPQNLISKPGADITDLIPPLLNAIKPILGSAADQPFHLTWTYDFLTWNKFQPIPSNELLNHLETQDLGKVQIDASLWIANARELFDFQKILLNQQNAPHSNTHFGILVGYWNPNGEKLRFSAELTLDVQPDAIYLHVKSKNDLAPLLVNHLGLLPAQKPKLKKKK